jgi:hypothetical protein
MPRAITSGEHSVANVDTRSGSPTTQHLQCEGRKNHCPTTRVRLRGWLPVRTPPRLSLDRSTNRQSGRLCVELKVLPAKRQYLTDATTSGEHEVHYVSAISPVGLGPGLSRTIHDRTAARTVTRSLGAKHSGFPLRPELPGSASNRVDSDDVVAQ